MISWSSLLKIKNTKFSNLHQKQLAFEHMMDEELRKEGKLNGSYTSTFPTENLIGAWDWRDFSLYKRSIKHLLKLTCSAALRINRQNE